MLKTANFSIHNTYKWDWNTRILLQENTFENAVCKMSTILFMLQYLMTLSALDIFVNVKKYQPSRSLLSMHY